mmetsp:Transcript_51637/g.159135  ORF Transcript_51637/g.159135 Transcript_51637/m.159135 type:complete len:290 (-) Transcript_51637:1118-1987(-)
MAGEALSTWMACVSPVKKILPSIVGVARMRTAMPGPRFRNTVELSMCPVASPVKSTPPSPLQKTNVPLIAGAAPSASTPQYTLWCSMQLWICGRAFDVTVMPCCAHSEISQWMIAGADKTPSTVIPEVFMRQMRFCRYWPEPFLRTEMPSWQLNMRQSSTLGAPPSTHATAEPLTLWMTQPTMRGVASRSTWTPLETLSWMCRPSSVGDVSSPVTTTCDSLLRVTTQRVAPPHAPCSNSSPYVSLRSILQPSTIAVAPSRSRNATWLSRTRHSKMMPAPCRSATTACPR